MRLDPLLRSRTAAAAWPDAEQDAGRGAMMPEAARQSETQYPAPH
ncbi:MAG TPA: hypothetical protein VF472_10965 [Burkholderiaceae bacterium]